MHDTHLKKHCEICGSSQIGHFYHTPGFNDTWSITIAAPIPKASSKGKGPIGRKSLLPKPKDDVMFSPLQHSASILETVLGSEDYNESKFALRMHLSILKSWASEFSGFLPIKFLK